MTLLSKLFGRVPEQEDLLCDDALLSTLAIERAMADRTGQVLSMVVFKAREDNDTYRMRAILTQTLKTRLRISDKFGMLDDERICAILPATTAEGAWKVADDVVLGFPEGVPPPLCEVLCYPSGMLSDAINGQTPRNSGAKRLTTSDATAIIPRQSIEAHAAAQTGTDSPSLTAAPLEAMFIRPTPIWKRALDIIGASLGIMALLPLLPFIAAAIKLTSPGPVFFTQLRSGLGGRPFRMWKFRTMVVNSEAKKASLLALNEQDGPAFKIKNDPRITKIGRILRKTSIDELPQLWNVLIGDMSLVGPRPLPCSESDQCKLWQRRRLDVTPGLTCIWQVRGRSVVTFDEWVRMDLQYIQEQSIAEDMKLIAMTVPSMINKNGR